MVWETNLAACTQIDGREGVSLDVVHFVAAVEGDVSLRC